MLTFHCEQWSVYCLQTHKFHFSATFSLKMGPTALFTHLKNILLQCFQFQFLVSAKISSIQTDPMCAKLESQIPCRPAACNFWPFQCLHFCCLLAIFHMVAQRVREKNMLQPDQIVPMRSTWISSAFLTLLFYHASSEHNIRAFT